MSDTPKPAGRKPKRPLVEIGASLITRYDAGHDKPYRVSHHDGKTETCWRFADADRAHLFSIELGVWATRSPPPPEMDRYAMKLGGVRE